MAIIVASNLQKHYSRVEKRAGLKGAIYNLFKAERRVVKAVDGISFTIDSGEVVGYLGPNGAGKSTTIKMLTGILFPTSGTVRINGLCPFANRRRVVQHLGVVFGQRTQLFWDLRLGESYEFLRQVYKVNSKQYSERLDWLNDHIGISSLLNAPVRQLSLGQRMRAEIGAALLHQPSILLLDEPTIGLDVEAKHGVRSLIKQINAELGTTVLITTHNLEDIEQLCNRVVVINHGTIVADDSLRTLIDRHIPFRTLIIDFLEPPGKLLLPSGEIMKIDGTRYWIKVNKLNTQISALIPQLLQQYAIMDISIREPNIEELISFLYRSREM